MRVNSKWLAVLLLLATLPLSGCGFLQTLRARDYSNKGVKAFSDQKYDAAAQFFEKAIQEDPHFEVARLYLATSYMSQFVPGSTDPKSEKMAMRAVETFEFIANNAENADNKKSAMIAIASLYYQLKRTNESKEWCNKVLKSDPTATEAYYRIAVVDYDAASEKTGVQGENIEYLSPDEKTSVKAGIEEGLMCLAKAIELKPDYWDAMEYQNLLFREKAKFESDEKLKSELIRNADRISLDVVKGKQKFLEEERKKPKKLGLSK
jgi:tetratricopeptide (TPR) repeat protein